MLELYLSGFFNYMRIIINNILLFYYNFWINCHAQLRVFKFNYDNKIMWIMSINYPAVIISFASLVCSERVNSKI